jgi:hypothetical protein
MTSKIKNYQDLEVWQKAMDLVVMCHGIMAEVGKMLNLIPDTRHLIP